MHPPVLSEANDLYKAGKWSAAIDAYKACIANGLVVSDEQKSDAYFSLGDAYDEIGELKEAVEWHSKVIELNRRDGMHPNSCSIALSFMKSGANTRLLWLIIIRRCRFTPNRVIGLRSTELDRSVILTSNYLEWK